MDSPSQTDRACLTFINAKVVLPDAVAERGSITVRDGVIQRIEPEGVSGTVHDCAGDVLMPGIVDIHTDHFEKHVFPRAHVTWDPLSAALAHDAQLIGSGITTVFDSLSVGTSEDDQRRRDLLIPMVDALEKGRAHGIFKAEHHLHLRCEICDEETPQLVTELVDRDAVAVASVMDHTPGVRQTQNVDKLIDHRARESGRPREVEAQAIADWQERVRGITERVRPIVVSQLRARNLPLMSHDDGTSDHIEEAIADGCTIAEFPTTLEAARAARARSMTIVAGAPNYLRGGSQSGNVAVADLLAEDLVDILASDYVPRSILDAVFRLASDDTLAITLPAATRMATLCPARLAGITDRGAIASGQRADLLQVGMAGTQPFVKAAWREGLRVA